MKVLAVEPNHQEMMRRVPSYPGPDRDVFPLSNGRLTSRVWRNDGVFGLVNKSIWRICLMSVRPIQHPVKVSTFVRGVEIGNGTTLVFVPIVRDYTYIRVAHDLLAEHIGTVVSMNANVRMASEGETPERTLPKCSTTLA